jgi:hypothetical protein
MRISLIPMRQAWGYDTMIDAECSTVGEMTGFRHSRARLPPHPPCPLLPHGEKGEASVPPHPPCPLLPHGEKGACGRPDA